MNKQTNNFRVIINGSVLLMLLFLTTGCNISEECFSCDPDLNAWAKTNKSKIIEFNREEIASFSHGRQKAILAVLSPERKITLWQEKIDHILSLDLSKEEINYLKWYADVFKSFDYKSPTPKDIEKEMYERTINGMSKFGWSQSFVYQTFFVLGDVDLVNLNSENTKSESGHYDCDCMYQLGCPSFLINDCQTTTCRTPMQNCGVFGNSECTGKCDWDI